jgi:cell division protein FtsL
MVKLNLLLVLVLVACALSVVSARHQARKLFVALQSEQAHGRDLDVEWGQLQLEISTWLMHNRVEEVARGRLQMTIPAPSRIYVLRDDTRADTQAETKALP